MEIRGCGSEFGEDQRVVLETQFEDIGVCLCELWEGVARVEKGQAALLCCSFGGDGECCCSDCTEQLWSSCGWELHLVFRIWGELCIHAIAIVQLSNTLRGLSWQWLLRDQQPIYFVTE